VIDGWVLRNLFDGPLYPQILIHWISFYGVTFETMFIWSHVTLLTWEELSLLTWEELRRIVQVCEQIPPNFLLNATFLEGVDSVWTSMEAILNNCNRFFIVCNFGYLIFEFKICFSIKINLLFFLLMCGYSEEKKRTNRKILYSVIWQKRLTIVCQKIDMEKSIE
jgi:hypothetical protein